MARVLVTRPEPGASRTAAALAMAGHEPVVRPLMDFVRVPWTMPTGAFDAVVLTSAAAAALAGDEASPVKRLLALCVGEATARAARAAGFAQAEAVGGDVGDVMARAVGMQRVLHLAGEERTAMPAPDGLEVVVRVVYRARLLALEDMGTVDAVMLYSERSAAHFVHEWGARSRGVLVVAMSDKVARAASEGWRQVSIAATPTEASMLAALAEAGL